MANDQVPMTNGFTASSATLIPNLLVIGARSFGFVLLLLHISTRKNTGYIVEHVGRAFVVVTEVANQSAFDNVDLGLRILIDDLRHEARQLDRVFLVLEQFQLQRLIQPQLKLFE